MKTEIIKIYNDWMDVKNVARTTVNKSPSKIKCTSSFKLNSLISEHSIIREVRVRWSWKGVKSWIATHFSRSSWECYISTQRDDRTKIDRNKSTQDTPVNMDGSANAQHLIDTSRKRLCTQTHNETREYWEDLKKELHLNGETELSFVLVPNCVYRCGCSEFEECGFWSKFIENSKIKNINLTNIKDRYKFYDMFYVKRNY